MGAEIDSGAVFHCDDVSRIERRGEVVYLTDISGSVELRRAMPYVIFLRCVARAHAIAEQWKAEQSAQVIRLRR